MLYHAYEMTHAAVMPMRAAARLGQSVVSSPMNPLPATYLNRTLSASMEMFINATRRYGKPAFGIDSVVHQGRQELFTPQNEGDISNCGFIIGNDAVVSSALLKKA